MPDSSLTQQDADHAGEIAEALVDLDDGAQRRLYIAGLSDHDLKLVAFFLRTVDHITKRNLKDVMLEQAIRTQRNQFPGLGDFGQ